MNRIYGVFIVCTPILLISQMVASIISWYENKRNPWKTKPVPKFEDLKNTLISLANENKTEKYAIKQGSDDDSYLSDEIAQITNMPEHVYGNIYRAILTLDLFISQHVNTEKSRGYLMTMYVDTVDSWNPDEETFLDAFIQRVENSDCIYLALVPKPIIL